VHHTVQISRVYGRVISSRVFVDFVTCFALYLGKGLPGGFLPLRREVFRVLCGTNARP